MNTQALKASSFRRVQARGLDFRVFDQGSGTPLLLLHRLPGRHADLVGRDPAAAAGRPWASGDGDRFLTEAQMCDSASQMDAP